MYALQQPYGAYTGVRAVCVDVCVLLRNKHLHVNRANIRPDTLVTHTVDYQVTHIDQTTTT